MFTEPFMQRALLAALFLGPLCAFMGVFVTARRMAFFSDTIAHAALTGVAVGFWFGLMDPTLPMIAVSLAVAGGIMWLRENTDLFTDTIMALLLSGSVAIGVIILSLLKEYRGELHSYLFGEILAIGRQEVVLAAVLFVVVGVGLFAKLSQLTLLTAHEEMAHVCGVPVRKFNYLFVIVLTLAVAVTIRLLGIILVTALIVIPPAAARNVSCNLRQQILFSIAFGVIGSVGGTMASYQFDVPCGAAIVLVCAAMFIGSLIFRRRAA
ncbi:MAG TPA: metal ABC transporter permease [Candidatus Acidoferrum sp.]|nr:metal ABC transporter permease [Candidatus Acidoferrum sp.]